MKMRGDGVVWEKLRGMGVDLIKTLYTCMDLSSDK